jgi:hypothetical protein
LNFSTISFAFTKVTITTEMETFTRDEMVPQRHRELNGPADSEEPSV